ncbi:MAG: glycosyltransferase family 39 protein [Candidatus Scalindua sp.]|nr:glycosyltransferase family 39 protein [Candidatus Scalindua sp.]
MKTFKYFQKNRSLHYIALLILVTVVLLTKGITQGDFWFSDDARHAMDGVFVLDFLKDLPVFNSYDYICQYYTKYPALGIGVYPPFFSLVEAIFYGLFGISAFSAKLTVLFFSLIAVLYWFRLIRLIFDEKVAFYSALLFTTTPLIVEWSRAVMLETPTLALVIMSVYFFYNFIELRKPRHGYYLIFATVAAIYTKQTAIFLIPIFFFYMILSKKYKMFLSLNVIMISFAIFILVLPLALVTFKYGSTNISQTVFENPQNEPLLEILLSHWSFYLINLFIENKPVLILSIITIFLLFVKNKRNIQKITIFFAWVLGFYVTFSYISSKDVRYSCFCILPFTLFAALLINEIPLKIRKTSIASILLVCLCLYQFVISYNLYNQSISGYEKAAQYIMENEADTVFFKVLE